MNSSTSKLVKNAFHLGIGQVATTALTMLVSAATARTLGASDFGLLYLLMSIANFSYVFIDWGHSAYITREVARHPQRTGELMGTVHVVRILMALLACGIVTIGTWLLGHGLRVIVLSVLIVLAWLPLYLAQGYSWAFRGRERMDYDAIINVAQKFLTLLVVVGCLALGGRVIALVLSSLITGIITFGLAMLLYRRLDLPRVTFNATTAEELVRGGAPMLALALAIAIQPYINANLLYKLSSSEVVGWFGVASTIAGTLVAPCAILSGALYPRFARLTGGMREFGPALRVTLRPLLAVSTLLAVGTYLFADVAVGLLYSSRRFGDAANILRAFAPVLAMVYVGMLFGVILTVAGKAGRFAITKAFSVLVTTGLAAVLIPYFQTHYGNGGVGVMIATAAGEVIIVFASVVMVREAVDRRMFTDCLRVLATGAMTILVMRVLPAMTPFLAIPLCVVVFGGLSLATGLVTRRELDLLPAAVWPRRLRVADASGLDPLDITQQPTVTR